jgi:hypothetical protein
MDMAGATCIFSTAPLWTALMVVGMRKVESSEREGGEGGKGEGIEGTNDGRVGGRWAPA